MEYPCSHRKRCRAKSKNVIEIEADIADQSSKAWTVVVYNELVQTIAYKGSFQRGETPWESISVKPGEYSLSLRYYELDTQAKLPQIKVDGAVVVDNKDCYKEFDLYQQRLEKIKQRRSVFYTTMHYYVYALLKWPMLTNEQEIREEYLPVGNPETIFRYGAIEKGKQLHVHCSNELLEKTLIYLVILNQSSFPQMWTRIEETEYETPNVAMSGTWLMRIVRIKGVMWNPH